MNRDFFIAFLMIFYIFMKLIFLPKKNSVVHAESFLLLHKNFVNKQQRRKIIKFKMQRKSLLAKFILISF